ncbi:MATE family efflux transporter [Gemmiger sp.]
MNFKSADIDMLHGPLTKSMLLFTLPIAFSSILQQLFNAADTAVVGYFGSRDALAAVGTNTEIIALVVTLSAGLSVGANLLVANRIGKGREEEIPSAVCTAIALAVLIGVPGLLLGQAAARPLLRMIQTPSAILPSAVLYLRIYMLGYPFLLLYDFGSAVLRARGNSRYPFWVLTLSGAVNVCLNVVFVVVFRMGVAGVAAATGLSNMLAALIILRSLAKEMRPDGKPGRPRPSRRDMGEMLEIGVPSAVQGAVFCFANIFVQASVNRFGETAIAGSTIAMNFEYFTYYIITAFGQTATTFTGQNHAAGQETRCRKILWLCLLLAAIGSSIPIFTVVLFRNFFSGLFTQEQAVIESAAVRILCILLFEPLCNLYEIPAGVLRGSEHALYPAVCTMLGTCAFRIVWIGTVFRSEPTLPMLYHAFPLSWVVTILLVNGGFLLLRGRENEK